MEKRARFTRILQTGETAAQCLFLLYTMLGFNSLTYGHPVISWVMRLAFLMGAGVLLVRLWNWKRYGKMPGIWCLVAMCGICFVSIVMNRHYGLKKNLIYLIFWVFYFFLFFAQREDMEKELVLHRFHVAGHMICGVTFLLGGVSLAMMLLGYSRVVEIQGNRIIRGFAQGRLFGAYLNPNGGAFVASAVIVLSVYFFRRYRKVWYRILTAGNIAVQFAYLVFSDSRGGRLCLALGMGAYAFFETLRLNRERQRKTPWLAALLLAALCVAGCWKGPKLVQNGYNALVTRLSYAMVREDTPEGETDPAQDPAEEERRQQILSAYQVSRGYDLSGDISNRRFDIWKSGLELVRRKPLYGLTFGGFLEYAQKEMPQTYIVANDYRQIDTMENDFMNLLVSNGAVSLVVFLGFILWILIRIFRRIFVQKNQDPAVPAMMAVCAGTAVFAMFNSSMLYSQCQVIPLFWLALGSLVTLLSGEEKAHE